MKESEQEDIVLYVIKKYGRPIGIQPLHRGIQVETDKRKLEQFDWIQTLKNLEEKGLIECVDGFIKCK